MSELLKKLRTQHSNLAEYDDDVFAEAVRQSSPEYKDIEPDVFRTALGIGQPSPEDNTSFAEAWGTQEEPVEAESTATFGNLISDTGKTLGDLPSQIGGSFAAAVEGSDPNEVFGEKDWKDEYILDARRKAEANPLIDGKGDTYVDLLGLKITREDIRNFSQNAAFSLTSMAASIGGAVPATAVGGPVAGYGAAALAGGATAYRIDTNNVLRDLRDSMDSEAEKQFGRKLTDDEFIGIAEAPEMQDAARQLGMAWGGKGNVADLISEHGYQEAGWEAVGNVAMMASGKLLFKLAQKTGILKPVGAYVGGTTVEVLSEAETQIGQANSELELGLRPGEKKRSYFSIQDQIDAIKEVAGPTVLLTGVLGGSTYTVGKINKAINKRIDKLGDIPEAGEPERPPEPSSTPPLPPEQTMDQVAESIRNGLLSEGSPTGAGLNQEVIDKLFDIERPILPESILDDKAGIKASRVLTVDQEKENARLDEDRRLSEERQAEIDLVMSDRKPRSDNVYKLESGALANKEEYPSILLRDQITALQKEAKKAKADNVNQYVIDNLFPEDKAEADLPAPYKRLDEAGQAKQQLIDYLTSDKESTQGEYEEFMAGAKTAKTAKPPIQYKLGKKQITIDPDAPKAAESDPVEELQGRLKDTKKRLSELARESQNNEKAGGQTVLNWLASNGGISTADAKKQGFDPADMKASSRKGMPFGKSLFNARGMTFEQAAERMAEIGIAEVSEALGDGTAANKSHSMNAAMEYIKAQVSGNDSPSLMPSAAEDEMEAAYRAEGIAREEQAGTEVQLELERLIEVHGRYKDILEKEGQSAADAYWFRETQAEAVYAEDLQRLSDEELDSLAGDYQLTDSEIGIYDMTLEILQKDLMSYEALDELLLEYGESRNSELAVRLHEILGEETTNETEEKLESSGTEDNAVAAPEAETGAEESELESIRKNIDAQGHDPDNAPYTPIQKDWEDFPIVKAVRKAEKETGFVYDNPAPEKAEVAAVASKDDTFKAVLTDIGNGKTVITGKLAAIRIELDKSNIPHKFVFKHAGEVIENEDVDLARNNLNVQDAATTEETTTAEHIEEESHKAASSTKNGDAAPTEAQIEANNYKKGHPTVQGFDISIENPVGSKRKPMWPTMKAHYGDLLSTIGADGDPVDVFVKPDVDIPADNPIYIIDQFVKGKFDEHKVMMGFDSMMNAESTYQDSYTKNWKGAEAITSSDPELLRMWLDAIKSDEVLRKTPYWEWADSPASKKPVDPDLLTVGTAPEHEQIGVDDRELDEIVDEFNDYQNPMFEEGGDVTNVFVAPKKKEVVRLNNKVKAYHKDYGWMTIEEAKAKVDEWEQHAVDQGRDNKSLLENGDKVVLSFFDLSGAWSLPWEQAGYQVFRFDIQEGSTVEHGGESINMGDITNFSHEFFADIFGSFEGKDIYAILAACPCTDFASSGARHFATKDEDGRTVASVKLVHHTMAAIEYFKPQVWALENPVGRIARLGGLPPWRLSFDPYHFGEDYTKKTLIWGRFNADLPIAPTEPTEGSKMHMKYGGKSMKTKNARSVTPEGFAYSFFMANNAIDNPVMDVANKFDRLDRGLMEKAIDAGITKGEIEEAVEDFYYMDLDDDAANAAIQDLIDEGNQDNEAQPDSGIWENIENRGDGSWLVKATKFAPKGKFAVVVQNENGRWDLSGGYQDTKEQAVKAHEGSVAGTAKGKAYREEIKVAQSELAAKLRSGEIPTKAEWVKAIDGVEEWHTYVPQPWLSPFLIEHFADKGFTKARIKKNLGNAAGVIRNDMGNEKPIIYLDKLADVLKSDDAAAKKSTGQDDIFGEDVSKEQSKADAKRAVDEKLSGTKDVPMAAGEGDLFSDAGQQMDIGDVAGTMPAQTGGEQVTPVPYASGMSTPKDFWAALNAGGGAGVGIDVSLLSEKMINEVVQALVQGHKVFIDSGAFRAFQIAQKAGEEISSPDFDEVMRRYKMIAELASTAKPEGEIDLMLVMPDVIGSMNDTVAELRKHKDNYAELDSFGAKLIVPIQTMPQAVMPGNMEGSYNLLLAGMTDIFGDVPFVVGIPSKAEALPKSHFVDLLKSEYMPDHIHILGAVRPAAITARMNVIREHYKDDVPLVTADANLIRARMDELKGENRAEQIAKIVRDEIPNDWGKATDDEIAAGTAIDEYAKYDGKEITYEVKTEDTGEVLSVSVDAGQAIREADSRIESLNELMKCVL